MSASAPLVEHARACMQTCGCERLQTRCPCKCAPYAWPYVLFLCMSIFTRKGRKRAWVVQMRWHNASHHLPNANMTLVIKIRWLTQAYKIHITPCTCVARYLESSNGLGLSPLPVVIPACGSSLKAPAALTQKHLCEIADV